MGGVVEREGERSREALPMFIAQSSKGEESGSHHTRGAIAVCPLALCQGHTAACDVRAEDDDHERQAAFLHAPGSARAQIPRPARGLGRHAQSLSACPAGTLS